MQFSIKQQTLNSPFWIDLATSESGYWIVEGDFMLHFQQSFKLTI